MNGITLAKPPFEKYLVKCVQGTENQLLLICPFIKMDVVSVMLTKLKKNVKIFTITRLENIDVSRGFIDLQAVKELSAYGEVRKNPRVHAKLLISDDKLALISSANLSLTGIYYNIEYGVLLNNKSLVSKITSFFYDVWNDSYTEKITKSDIEKLQELVNSEYYLADRFQEFISENVLRTSQSRQIGVLLQKYINSVHGEKEKELVFNIVKDWLKKDTQPGKIVKLLVSRKNVWISPQDVSTIFKEIKDPNTVLYDLARRGSKEYYLRTPKYYPRSYRINPIIEYDKSKGYRIRPQIFDIVSQVLKTFNRHYSP